MLSLPIFWSFGAKKNALQEWSDSVPILLNSTLQCISERVLQNISGLVQADDFDESESNSETVVKALKFSSSAPNLNCIYYSITFEMDKVSAMPSTQQFNARPFMISVFLRHAKTLCTCSSMTSCTCQKWMWIDPSVHGTNQEQRCWCRAR